MLNAFITKNKLKRATGRDASHLDMSGGVINIPLAMIKDFTKTMAAAYNANEKYYIIEQKTPFVRVFMDLDFLSPLAISFDYCLRYIVVIQRAVKELFADHYPDIYSDNETFKVVICTAPSKNVEKDGKSYLKTGVHLLWPNWISTKDILTKVRLYVIERLEKHFGPRDEINPHKDVVDGSVFKGSGLRCIGSSKMENCKTCKNKKDLRINCAQCGCKGRIEDDRRYKPVYVMDSAGLEMKEELTRLKEDAVLMFTTLTIRTDHTTLPEKFNIMHKINELQEKKTRKKTKKPCAKSFSEYTAPGTSPDEIKVALPRNAMTNSIQKFIRSREFGANRPYKDIEIRDIFRVNDEYYVVSTECKFCLNHGKEHHNNNIYFYIDSGHVYQKCLCNCEVIRQCGKVFCKDWRSVGQPIDDLKILKYLFPDLAAKHKGGTGGIHHEFAEKSCFARTCENAAIFDKQVQEEERFLNDLEYYLKNKSVGM